MGRFNNDRFSGRRSSSGGGGGSRFGGGRPDRPTVMHEAVCDDCGKNCEVPFKPSGDKPIYCRDCFDKRGGGDSDRGPRRESSSRDFRSDSRGSRSSSNEMFSAVCDDCGKDCEVPFRPSGDKPIYCSRCFENRGNSHEGERNTPRSFDNGNRDMMPVINNDGQRELLENINTKLDRILAALEPKKVEPKVVEVKKVVKKKVVKAKKEEVVVAE